MIKPAIKPLNSITFRIILMVAFTLLLYTPRLPAQSIIRDVNDPSPDKSSFLIVPYCFYNDYFEGAFGVAFGSNGYIQEQSRTFSTVLQSTNTSFLFSFLGYDFRLPGLERIFIDPQISIGKFRYQRAYINGNPDFSDDIAGSNDSNKDNYIEAKGWDTVADITISYLLPIGSGRDTIINTYYLNQGVLESGATGGDEWNPLKTGLTSFIIKPFYRMQSYELPGDETELNTNGIEIALEYNNTDFFPNPSTGSVQRISMSRDFGCFNSSDSWMVIEGEISKYFSFGPGNLFRQRVLALNAWTAGTPGWNKTEIDGVVSISNRPPQYKGATLGGFHRLRAYPSNRFNDRAAFYATAEYRIIPQWHPLGDVAWLNRWLLWDWWQFTGYVEAGRVAEKWEIDEFLTDIKWDAGIGIRGYMRKVLIRIETSWSEEGIGMTFWAKHPF